MRTRSFNTFALTLMALPVAAQQTGAIVGKVTTKDGRALPSVRIEATSSVLPQPRRVLSGENGEFRLPLLPPGPYSLAFTHPAKASEKRSVSVVLQQNTTVNIALADAKTPEAEVEVVAQATLVDASSAELKSYVTHEVLSSLPVGLDYRDLMRLIPGVQVSQDTVRGPSAGGSGQDNVHHFDGVNVNLPLYGTLPKGPSSHDMDQIAIVKGGAAATDFNRSAGYSINSISKSGTNTFQGGLSFQAVPAGLVASRRAPGTAPFEPDERYTMADVSGPIVKERLFFFTSYYRPTVTQENLPNVYGPVPDYESSRDEFFGKLTYAPSDTILLHGSYRTSNQVVHHYPVGLFAAASTSAGAKATLNIGILEGAWIISPSSFLNFKYTTFANKTQERPDTPFAFKPALDGSVSLNVGALDTQGFFGVPTPDITVPIDTAYNAFIAPLISKYGFLSSTGERTGGGQVGGDSRIANTDFYRRSYQLAYDAVFGSTITHEFHVGYQRTKEWEDLYRISNGWGSITAPQGATFSGQPVAFQAQVQQQGILGVPTLHSEFVSQNLEVNDRIRWRAFTFNVGLLASNDKLYGQGLRKKSGTVSGFELAPGSKYEMHEIKFKDALQPRLGLTWAYHAEDTVYANFARYVPAASSLPRAASWARNKAATINAFFNASGAFIGSSPEASSSGKIFAANLKPRFTDEYLMGTTRDFGRGLTARLHARYRRSTRFWEDTNNDARVLFNPPPGIPRELYIPNLAAIRAEIGGSTFVIAALDGAITKYYETGLEADWRRGNAYFRGSYVWSHYYGNFDQDNTSTTTGNDNNLFIGSSNIADDAGRQLWNFKYGNLAGDRRHQVKLYGYYAFPWQGKVGAFAFYQSGQPWQFQSYEPYLALIGNNRSDTNRYVEPAGSRRTSPHSQLDLNYTQSFLQGRRVNLDVFIDVYNVFDKQTGYNIQSSLHTTQPAPGTPQTYYLPRRTQLGARMRF